MANTAKSKKAKGVRLESYIVGRFRDVLGVLAKRMPKSGALKDFKSDIYTDLPISIEAKNQESWKIHEWWLQAKKDAGEKNVMPSLVINRNRLKEPLVVLSFEDFLILLKYAIKGGWNKYVQTKKVSEKSD